MTEYKITVLSRFMGRELKTTGEVIDALGGTNETAKIVRKKMQHVSNWRASGRFPCRTFMKFKRELDRRGLSAPSELWGMDDL